MQKPRINLQEVRNFSDSFTATFVFVKQEFKSLITAFAVIMLPLIFADLFVKGYTMRSLITDPLGSSKTGSDILSLVVNYFSTLVLVFWLGVFVISFLRVYTDKFKVYSEERITVKEVWRVMSKHLGKAFIVGVVYLLAVSVGTVMLIIPGIYVSVILIFSIYYLILRDNTITGSLGDSADLVKGQWWSLFGFIFILNLIISMLSYVFTIPYLVITLKSVFTREPMGIYESTFGMLLANLGQYFLYIFTFVGIGVRFFSSLERQEHTLLLNKIEHLGNNGQTANSEETL